MSQGSSIITHKPDHYDVISERDDHGGERIYMEFNGPLLGRVQLAGDVTVRFELTIDDVIIFIQLLQRSCAWFAQYMTKEQRERLDELRCAAYAESSHEQTVGG